MYIFIYSQRLIEEFNLELCLTCKIRVNQSMRRFTMLSTGLGCTMTILMLLALPNLGLSATETMNLCLV